MSRKSGRDASERAPIGDRLGEAGVMAGRAASGLILVGLGVGWLLSVEPLQERVCEVRAVPVSAVLEWPTIPGASEQRATWVPAPMQDALTNLVERTVSEDPFDGATLREARVALASTGWFRAIGAVRREPGGEVRIDAEWRTPAAVVRKNGAEHRVWPDGAPMRLPEGTAPPAGLFRIIDPRADAPQDADTGAVRYGVPWHFDDVHMAIALLERISSLPETSALVGVDLAEYRRSGRLALVSDAGCRLIWGAPLDEPKPGETTVERKIAHLRTILDPARRLDRLEKRIELFTDHVFIHRTPAAPGSPGTNPAGGGA